MVRHLVRLKALLTWNGARSDVQRRFGLPIATVLLILLGWWLAAAHYRTASTLAETDPTAIPGYLGWTALFVFFLWIALPVVIFPLDENLDPQRLAVLPISSGQMVTGLAAASFVAPSVFIPLLLLTANARILTEAWWMAIPASLVYMSLLAVGGQLFSAIMSAILRTRRGRDIATFLVLGIAAGSFLIYRTISQAIDGVGMAAAIAANPITDWSLLIPPVAAQQAIVSAAAHNPIAAFAALGSAVVGLLVLVALWRRVLNWLLTTPEQRSRPAARARRLGMATGPWGVIPTLARKEFRFYIRDPRQRLVWTGTVIFIGIAVAGVIMNTTGFFDIRDRAWAPLAAPILVLFVGLPIVLNLFGWERNAASYLFVLPAKPRQLLLGKNLAVATALGLETVLLTLGIAFFSGHWQWVWLVLPLTVAAIGSQLAVGNIVSVLAPLRLPREGTDVFAQSTEQGCLAIVSQTFSFFTIGLLLVPPASMVVLTVDFGQVVAPWLTAVATVIWGVTLYVISLALASRLLKRRLPEVLSWVQVV